jgi:hypothetical protein
MPHGGDWHTAGVAGVAGMAERFAHPLLAATGTGPSEAPTSEPRLRLDGNAVALTALRRVSDGGGDGGSARPATQTPGWLELRCVNESPDPTTATISAPRGVDEVHTADLLGRPGDKLAIEGSAVHLDLDPWRIATIRLRCATGAQPMAD